MEPTMPLKARVVLKVERRRGDWRTLGRPGGNAPRPVTGGAERTMSREGAADHAWSRDALSKDIKRKVRAQELHWEDAVAPENTER